MAGNLISLEARRARQDGHAAVDQPERWWTIERQRSEDHLELQCLGDLHFGALTKPGAVPTQWLGIVWRTARWWQAGREDLRTLQTLLDAVNAAGVTQGPIGTAAKR